MGRLGEILEVLYEAPRVDGPLHIRARHMMDQTVIDQVHDWWKQQLPFDGSSSALLITSGGGELERAEDTEELWWLGPDRWRADAGDLVTVLATDALYTYYPAVGGLRDPDRQRLIPTWSALLEPRWLLGRFDLEVGEPTNVAGRECWSLELRLSSSSGHHRMAAATAPWLGQEHSCHIDQETGIVLAVEGRFQGEVCASWVTTAFELPATIDPSVFEFVPPDGSGFRDPREFRIESMLRLAAERDIDLSGVDLEDDEQLSRAVMLGPHAPPFPLITPEERAEQYVPTGPLPADLARAEAQVRDAFERIVTLSDDGEAVPAVEGGENLGPALREAGTRAPGGSGVPATVAVDFVKFISANEAVVWFSLDRGGQMLLPSIEGNARLVGDHWLATRPTFAKIVGSIGVRCPPPPGP